MDDYNLGEDIDQHADEVEGQIPSTTRFSNDDAHLEPTRWWFASSAFPMIAGTLGPVASAFSICSLVRPWRQQLHPGGNPSEAPFVNDPPWLTSINAIQLAVALVANVFLLLNMTRRVRFTVAQPITMIGWYISAILLMILAATAAGPLASTISFPKGQLMWSQGFYYGIWAAILYFLDASFMVVTYWGARSGRYSNDFALSTSQRTLMLQTIMLLGYLLLGALVFSSIENWNYLDGLYWADVTLFTIGFGDYAASTTLGKALLLPYALVGIISLGLVIGSIRSMILERGRRRVEARIVEKARRKMVRTMTLKGDGEILRPVHANSNSSSSPSTGKHPNTEYERRQHEFELMRKIQVKASIRRKWVAMGVSFTTWIVLWTVGAAIFLAAEKPYQPWWTYFDAFYFCFVSFTTIGYGDITPISNCGKAFFVFWSLLALPTLTVLISNAGDTVVKFVRDATLQLGNVTILPGDRGFKDEIRSILQKLSFGKLFSGFANGSLALSAKPERRTASPSDAQRPRTGSSCQGDNGNDDEDDYDDDEERRGRTNTNLAIGQGIGNLDDDREGRQRARSTFTAQVRRSLSRIRDPLDDLPKGTDFHFLLISEIQVVSHHLRESPPHRYSFDEWAWYLKLIGEDERDPQRHRMAKPHTHNRGGVENREEKEKTKWSWVGYKSPLMGSQEESEWILQKLVERLKESLSAAGRRPAKERKQDGRAEANYNASAEKRRR